jgi:hypothetical protein
MSTTKEADEAVMSYADHGPGTLKPAGLLARLKGERVDLNDVAKAYFQESLQYDQAQLERDSAKVRRKLDFIVLPMVS